MPVATGLTPDELRRGHAVLPRRTQRKHWEPAWKGDRLSAMAVLGHVAPGRDKIRAADTNYQWYWRRGQKGIAGEAYACHYAAPGKNNWRHIKAGATAKSIRPMTRTELRRTEWDAEDVALWRRPKAKGGWEKPATYRQMARAARAHGGYIIAELKDAAFALLAVARYMVAEAAAAGHPPWFMALFGSMTKCREKCAAIKQAGGQFLVIFGRASLTRRWRPVYRLRVRTWSIKPDAVG
jgi:hypothetical protein